MHKSANTNSTRRVQFGPRVSEVIPHSLVAAQRQPCWAPARSVVKCVPLHGVMVKRQGQVRKGNRAYGLDAGIRP